MTYLDAEYHTPDGRPTVSFERTYRVPVEEVWEVMATPRGLAMWFPSPEVHYEPEVGSRITFGGDPYQEEALTGTVIAYEHQRRFGFDWGTDQLHLSVEPDPAGSRFRLINTLGTEDGAARNAAGWDACLDQFELAVTGTPAGSSNDGTVADFTPVLAAYVAKGFPDDGWVPEAD